MKTKRGAGVSVMIPAIAAVLCAAVALVPLSSFAEAPLKKASLLPQWSAQAQFAGYMVALDKGFYREAGIDMTLLEGGPHKPPVEWLKSGRALFGTEWLSTALEQRAAGLKIVNLAQIVQRSAVMLVARKSSGILKPQDLNGRRVGLWPLQFAVPEKAFFRKLDLKPVLVRDYASIVSFLKGDVEACPVMWYNEYHQLLDNGLKPDELTVFTFHDYGIHFPEDGIYCMEETYRNDPDLCRAFAAASLKGWRYALDHQDETLDIVMKYVKAARVVSTRERQKWMLARMKDIIATNEGSKTLGKLDPTSFASVGKILKHLSIIKEIPQYDEFYKGIK